MRAAAETVQASFLFREVLKDQRGSLFMELCFLNSVKLLAKWKPWRVYNLAKTGHCQSSSPTGEASGVSAGEPHERIRRILGLGGPHWNNFEQQWEGEGAAEMEMDRQVVAETRRRKAEREAHAPSKPVTIH
jgi:hypothetical protein